MLKILISNQFKRDLKMAKKRNLNLNNLKAVVNKLASGKALEAKHRDHSLTGKYRNFRECHIEPDWLLIYKLERDMLRLMLFRTGSHSDLF